MNASSPLIRPSAGAVIMTLTVAGSPCWLIRTPSGGEVRWNGRTILRLSAWFTDGPESSDAEALAEIANFFLGGPDYQVIRTPDELRTLLESRIAYSGLDPRHARVAWERDLAAIGPPRIEDGILRFYCVHMASGEPYVVRLPCPFRDGERATYELLPARPSA